MLGGGGRDIISVNTMATYGGRESWMAVFIETSWSVVVSGG